MNTFVRFSDTKSSRVFFPLVISFFLLFFGNVHLATADVPTAYPPEERAPWPESKDNGKTDDEGDGNQAVEEEVCEAYKVKISEKDENDNRVVGENVFFGSGASLTCLDQIVDDALDHEGLYDELLENIDEALRRNRDIGYPKPTSKDDVRDMIRVWSEDSVELAGMHEIFREFYKEADDDIAEYVEEVLLNDNESGYIDSQCRRVRNPTSVCGNLEVRYISSPISLIWDEKASLDDFSLVNFPLDPNPAISGWWYTWKASKHMPLLVLNESSSKTVSNGTQLFGNHTFGGPKFALLNRATNDTPPATIKESWENGFQALATLDLDGDGALRGDELKALALWFDNNNDAKTDPGELKSLKEMQVTALFYSPDRVDPKTGDVHASLGFERTLHGKVTTGASVDWYAQIAPSKFELLSQLMIQSKAGAHLLAQDLATTNRVYANPNASSGSKVSQRKFLDGIWQWKIKDRQNYPVYKPQGIITFATQADGRVRGHSIGQVPLKPNRHNVHSSIGLFKLEGYQETLDDGRIKVSFELVDRSGVKTLSTAILSADGSSLTGESKMSLRNARSKEDSLDYGWTATRYIPRKK
jgi:hypothetical protein